MTKSEIIGKMEAELGTRIQNVIPLNRIDGIIDKIYREKKNEFNIDKYVKRVINYDFRRPDKFSKDQIRTMSIIHETFARLSTTGLSSVLRTECLVHVSVVDQMTYGEFMRSVPDQSAISILNMVPLNGNALLEMDPSVTFAVIERLFGENGNLGEDKINRNLTEIEQGTIEGVVIRLTNYLREAWSNIIDMHPGLSRIETNPQFVQIVPPSDMVITVSLDIKINNVIGFMNLCLPYLTIEPLINKLSGKYWYSSIRKKNDYNLNMNKKIGDVKLPAKIVIPAERVSIKKLYNLKKGDLIKIKGYHKNEFLLYSGDVPVMKLFNDSLRKKICFKVVDEDKKNDWTGDDNDDGANKEDMASLKDKQFEELSNKISDTIGNMEMKIEILSKKQDELLDGISFSSGQGIAEETRTEEEPFGILNRYDVGDIARFIGGEHPQTVAMILSYLKPDFGGKILSLMPDGLKVRVIKRISSIDPVHPDVIRNTENILIKKMQAKSNFNYQKQSGIETVVEILNLCPRNVEKTVIDGVEKDFPVLAEEIKKRMFVFEDIVLLDNRSLKKVLGSVDKDDLALSIKSVNDEVKKRIYDNLGRSEIEEIEKKNSETGPVKLTKIEECQQRIVGLVRVLESRGEISISRTDEEVV
jgi:flagellar motor switch protein FliM